MEDMIHHSAAVSRGLKNTLLVCDMPFMSYQTSVYDAVVNAGRLMKEGHANMVKLEGGVEVVPQIEAIVKASIPVCAHIGLTPQSSNAVQAAGATMVVLEAVPAKLATKITEMLDIPTIGIGAGNGCDGQVLVYQDMLGMFTDYVPKFVRQFANVGEVMKQAFTDYINAVGDGSFPKELY